MTDEKITARYNYDLEEWVFDKDYEVEVDPESVFGQASNLKSQHLPMNKEHFFAIMQVGHGNCSGFIEEVEQWMRKQLLNEGLFDKLYMSYDAWYGLWCGYQISQRQFNLVTDKQYKVIKQIQEMMK